MNTHTLYPTLTFSGALCQACGKAPAVVASALLALLLLLTSAAHAQQSSGDAEARLVAIATPPSSTPSARMLDDRYAATLHGQIAAVAKYPNSREARQLRAQGLVGLWVELDRNGRVVDARITAGSGQTLLDMEALRNVRNGRYAAFPATAYPGESSHRFAMTLEYPQAGR